MHLLEVEGENDRLRSTGRGIVPPRPALLPDPALRRDGSCWCPDDTPVMCGRKQRRTISMKRQDLPYTRMDEWTNYLETEGTTFRDRARSLKTDTPE